MDHIAVDKLVRICIRECLRTTALPTEIGCYYHEQMYPSIRNLIIVFLESAEENYAQIRLARGGQTKAVPEMQVN